MSARSPRRLTSDEFTRILSLLDKQQWLRPRQNELFELIDLCQTVDEQILVCDLLHRFLYFTSAEIDKAAKAIADKIMEDWKLPPNNTIIVAMDPSHEADGSKVVLYHLKNHLNPDDGWSESNLSTNIGDVAQNVNTGTVVLIDDFCGTGETIERRYTWLKNRLSSRGLTSIDCRVCVVAAMEFAQYKLSGAGIPIFSVYSLKKAITEHLAGSELQTAVAAMKRIESELMQNWHGQSWDSLGYQQSESLYSYEGNSPDNVFPIFWWRRLKTAKLRNTLLRRLGK